eukprot:4344647-Amphidinium_carterae.1
MVDIAVADVDDTLMAFSRRTGKLLQDLEKTGTTSRSVSKCLWTLKPLPRTECLRVFRQKLTHRLTEEQRARVARYMAMFDGEKPKVEKVFTLVCLKMHDEHGRAEAFLEDILQARVRALSKSEAGAMQRAIQGRFKNPDEFMQECDKHFILNHADRDDAELLRYFVDPEHSCRAWAEVELERSGVEAICNASRSLQISIDEYVRALKASLSYLRSVLSPAGMCVAQDLQNVVSHTKPLDDADASEVLEALKQFLQLGKASFTINGEVVEAVGRQKLDLPDELCITGIDDLDTFLEHCNRLLTTEFGDDWVQEQRLDGIVLDQVKHECIEAWLGCPEHCPYCWKLCTHARHDPSEVKHSCTMHQPHGFGGVRIVGTNTPQFLLCDSFENRHQLFAHSGEKETFLPFEEH